MCTMKKRYNIYDDMLTFSKALSGFIFLMVILVGCNKDYLDAKPSQTLGVPTTINDFLLLLNNSQIFNARQPFEGEESADDYYLKDSVFLTRTNLERNIYTWAPGNLYGGAAIADWSNAYSEVWYSDVILDGIGKVAITAGNQNDW